MSNQISLKERDAAKALGVTPRTLYSWRVAGKIPHRKVGNTVLYPVAWLRRWLGEGKQWRA
jgi:excisionase family DNA binding protein